jgi:hypothetical protein
VLRATFLPALLEFVSETLDRLPQSSWCGAVHATLPLRAVSFAKKSLVDPLLGYGTVMSATASPPLWLFLRDLPSWVGFKKCEQPCRHLEKVSVVDHDDPSGT